jgi:predicted PurR-regulated permease PerM
MTKQVVKFGMAVMVALLALVMLWQFRIVVIYVLISLALAAALRPLTNRLIERGWAIRVLWILLYLLALASFCFLLFLTGEAVIYEIQQLAHIVSAQDKWMLPAWLEGSPFQLALVAQLPPPSKLFEAITGDQGQLVLPAIFGFTQSIGEIFSGTFVILFLSLYWSSDQVHFERLWLSLLPSALRKRARDIWRTIETDLGAYIRSEVIQSILAAALLGAGYWLIGSPTPWLLALMGALLWLIPVIGAPLAVALPLGMGLFTSAQLGLTTALYTIVILFVLQFWVEPHLFRRNWDNPILTLVILLAMADAFGMIGILVAPPISAVCQILWKLLVSNPVVSGSAVQISDLKERQARAWEAINAMDEPPIALVTNSMQRLSLLIEKAEPLVQAEMPAQSAASMHLPGLITTGEKPND